MSMFDNIRGMFSGSDDYSSDYEDDYEDYNNGYDSDDDYENDKDYQKHKLFGGSKSKSYASGKIVPINTDSKHGLEVVVIRPESMEDASEITDTLLSGKAVVLNLEGIHIEVAQRIIDYSSGSCYAMDGNLQKITNYIFIVTPKGVDISGDIPEKILSGGVDLSAFGKTEQKL